MDSITRKDKFKNLDKTSQKLEKMDTLNDLISIYDKKINNLLDSITPDKTLKNQIKSQMKLKTVS